MIQELPVRPSLEHLKAQAKDLLDAFRHQAPPALQRFRQSLPGLRGLSDPALSARALALHDAQSVIAREYGFASWARLRAHVENAAALQPAHSQGETLAPSLPEALRLALVAATAAPAEAARWPDLVPLLPMRDMLIPPALAMPIFIGRASSLAALDAACAGEGLLAIFAQHRFADEKPGAADVHAIGIVARVCASGPMPDGTRWAVIKGQSWVKLEALLPQATYALARVSAFEIGGSDAARTKTLEKQLRQLALDSAFGPATREISSRIQAMNARELADMVVLRAPVSVADKAGYVAEPELSARLEKALGFMGVRAG